MRVAVQRDQAVRTRPRHFAKAGQSKRTSDISRGRGSPSDTGSELALPVGGARPVRK